MVYNHVLHLYGEAARDHATGDRQRIQVEPRALYRFDGRGKLVCGSGYLDRVYTILKRAGFAIDFQDITPMGPRPRALEADWLRVMKRYEFRIKQWEILDAVARRIAKSLGGVVQVPPGVGKSYLFAAYGLLYPQARIAITAPDIDNCRKTHAHMLKYLPSVGIVGGGARQHRRVTVYTLGSLHHCDDDVDLLLVDEAHKYMAEKASGVLGRAAPRAVRVAFTATPEGRMDGGDAKMECLFGPVIYKMTWQEATELALIVPIEVRWLPVELPFDQASPAAGHQGVFKKKFGIWTNTFRNRVIATAARLHEDDQVLIMVASIEHAVHIRKQLPEFELCYGNHDEAKFAKYEKGGHITEGFIPVDPERREQMRQAFEAGTLKKVIATDIWSTGVSFDSLGVMIRADARTSTILNEQIPGRVSRTHTPSGKSVGILYDLDDRWDRGFQMGGMGRARDYREKGWQQIREPTSRQGFLF
jgi:superfamily II DNA or RNA helicase